MTHASKHSSSPLLTEGQIFDVQRCSLHDGPGIRTTVFLKGCPLRCLWCHNPESQASGPELLYTADRCAACGACVAVCPAGAHTVDASGHHFDRARCTACGACVEACLHGALERTGRTVTVEAVLDEVERDRPFYEHSGGGMTLSGGEPLAQPAFSEALLAGAHARGLHTCVETSGLGSADALRRLAVHTDLFLLDWKATDPARHRQLTGADNAPIRQSLHRLLAGGSAVVLRCPLVPGVNDDEAHLAGIAALAAEHPTLAGVELLAYHELGSDKARRLGRDAPLPGVRSPDEQTRQRWVETLARLGCEATIR